MNDTPINDIHFLHEELTHDLPTDRRIAILGCGAVGANLAISLARRGFMKFWLADDGRVQEHHFSTQPWVQNDLGQLKVQVLSGKLFMIAGAQSFAHVGRIYSVENLRGVLPKETAVIVDCFDGLKSIEIVQQLVKSGKPPVVHTGVNTSGTGYVTWYDRYHTPTDIDLPVDPSNYPLSRTMVELVVVAAAESVVDFLKRGWRHSFLIDDENIIIGTP